MRVGILELISDKLHHSRLERLYSEFFTRQQVSVMPQAVAVWCRQLGHRVFYATYYGQQDPKSLLPDDLDVVFIATYSQPSALAYALAKLFRREKTLTVIGGPHARAFPHDCLRFFDLVVQQCDKLLIEDILAKRFDSPAIISSGRPLWELPSVEERLPEISASAFYRGRPRLTSVVSLVASTGCPYQCDFCVDWDKKYTPFPMDRLAGDLDFISRNWPGVLVGFQDPNFAVRFDEMMDVMETLPEGRRNPYIMESSLSNLKQSRLQRLRKTNCVYVAPGVESWGQYANKAGSGGRMGRKKLEHVIGHIEMIRQYVPGLQVNLLFGTDADEGGEPVELTKEFIRRVPFVWPTVNIPLPIGSTPLYENSLAEDRILESLPFSFYISPYLTTKPVRYGLVEFYDHLIDIYGLMASKSMFVRRLAARTLPSIRIIHSLRTIPLRFELEGYRAMRKLLASDPVFRAFHEGRDDHLPEFYRQRFEQRLGRYSELITERERIPVHEQNGSQVSNELQARRAAPESVSGWMEPA